MGRAQYDTPRLGVLVLDTWGGRTRTPVDVIGQTSRNWRIRAIADTRLAGRNRVLPAGAVASVPKRAIVFPEVS